MKSSTSEYLVCPKCKHKLNLIIKEEVEGNIVDGQLKCSNQQCLGSFIIVNGFADLCVLKYPEEQDVVDSFGFEWNAHHKGKIEKHTVFGRDNETDTEYFFKALHIRPEDLKDKLVIDVGCGSAKLTKSISSFSPSFVFGTDINEASPLSAKYCFDVPNCEVIRSDIFNLPFAPEIFDIVWCNGVIHHTPYPSEAFSHVAHLVKPGGTLYVWVYEKRFSPFNQVKDIFRLLRLDRIPHFYLFDICKILSILSVGFHAIWRGSLYFPNQIGILKTGRLLRTLRYRPYGEFLMTWFDSLSPRFDSRHTREEVSGWFMNHGFHDLRYYDDQIGICGIKRL